jgi:RimJ/RimL family protein N-acetyltransferase
MSVILPLDGFVLRALVPADAESLALHANDRDLWLNLRDLFPHPYSVDDARAYIAHAAARPVQTSFGIVVNGAAVGSISLKPGTDIERHTAEIGYWLGRAVWGKGIATQAVRTVTRYAFDTLGMHRVFAVPFAANLASQRVLEKAGYVRECVMRRSAVKDGVVHDQILYAVTDPGSLG